IRPRTRGDARGQGVALPDLSHPVPGPEVGRVAHQVPGLRRRVGGRAAARGRAANTAPAEEARRRRRSRRRGRRPGPGAGTGTAAPTATAVTAPAVLLAVVR